MPSFLFIDAFVFLFGAIVGSFLNVCIYRIPAEKSIVSPPSHCPSCGERVRPYDNIPLLSWLLLGGKCRFCRARISVRYPLVELLTALLTLFLFHEYGFSAGFAALFLFSAALVVITFIDLDHQIIPDIISLPGIPLGFAFSFFLPQVGWKNSLIGILVGGGSLLVVAYAYELITKKEGMGGGDIKLLAMMGAFLGWKSIPFIIFISSLLGSVIGISLMIAQKKDSKLAIPFGPFLATAAVIYIFFGDSIIGWYLNVGAARGYPSP